MSSLKVSGLTAQGAASADDLLYLVDTEDGGETYASKSITVGNFLNGYATESFVSTQLDALVNGAPAALDTLKELSDALGADSNFSTTITNLINANEVHVDNMASLTGVAKDNTTLGTFTGSTIGDSLDIKSALQALETSLETKGDATLLSQTTSKANDLVLLSGMPAGSGNLGTFTGSTISDDTTVKSALQELETEIARVDADITTQINAVDLSGIATNAGNIATLQVDLNTEAAARAAADTAEATARTNADSALSNRLDSLEADPTTGTALSSEASTRAAADTLLSGRLDALEADPTTQTLLTAEATARASADSTLQSNIDAEEAARIAADSTLTTNLSQEVTDRTAAVTAEAAARSAADTTLQSNIDAEEAARIAADNTLTTNLAQEVSDRTSAVTAEATARSSADTTLQSNLDAEEAARIAADDAEAAARAAADALLLPLAGGTMSGAIQLGAGSAGTSTINSVFDASTSINVNLGADSLSFTATSGFASGFLADKITADTGIHYFEFSSSEEFVGWGLSANTVTAALNSPGDVKVFALQSHVSQDGNPTSTTFTAPASGYGPTVVKGFSYDSSTGECTWYTDGVAFVSYTADKTVNYNFCVFTRNTTTTGNTIDLVIDAASQQYAPFGTGASPATIGVDGTASFSGLISAPTAPTADEHLVNKLYADNLVAGVDLSGIATNAAAIEALTNGAPELLNTLNELADAIGDDENFATTVTNQIAAETTARQASDVTLQSNIDSEAAARSAADTTLQSNIDAEEAARIAADNTLTTNLAQEVTDRTAAVSAEASARAAADALLLPLAGGTMSGDIQMGVVAGNPQMSWVHTSNSTTTGPSCVIFDTGDNTTINKFKIEQAGSNNAVFQYSTDGGAWGSPGNANTFEGSQRYIKVKTGGEDVGKTITVTLLESGGTDPILWETFHHESSNPEGFFSDVIDTGYVSLGGGGLSTIGVDGTASFSGLVSAATAPTADAHLVNKLYADNLVAGVDLSGIATNAANLAQEVTDRQAGDSALQAAINAEEAARIAADAQLLQLTGGSMAGPIDFGGVTTINPDGSADFAGLISADSVPTLPQHLTNKLYVDTQLAVNAAAIEAVVGGAPELLNTLNELAEAISDDENFATTVTNSIATESAARSSADVTLQSNIDAESASRVAADNLLTVNLNTEITDRQLADTTETAARIAADNTLTTNLATEVTDRQSAVAAEEAARIAADNTLTANLNQEISDRQAAITNESSARATADTTLQSNIDAEAAARSAADLTLTTNLAQEVTDRTAAVSAEETARIAADALLLPLAGGTMSGDINFGGVAETTGAYVSNVVAGGESDLAANLFVDGSSFKLRAGAPTTFTPIVAQSSVKISTYGIYPENSNDFQIRINGEAIGPTHTNSIGFNAEYSLSGVTFPFTVSNISVDGEGGSPNRYAWIQHIEIDGVPVYEGTVVTMAGEVSAAQLKADGSATFSGLISASTAPTANEHLTNKLYVDSKAATNAAAIEALTNGAPELLNTLNELAQAIGDDENFSTTVTNQIAAETTARQASDVTLQSNIDSEAATRSGADSTLQSNIDAEEAARTAAVSAEEAARIAADALLLPLAGGTMSGAINLGSAGAPGMVSSLFLDGQKTYLIDRGEDFQNTNLRFAGDDLSVDFQYHTDGTVWFGGEITAAEFNEDLVNTNAFKVTNSRWIKTKSWDVDLTLTPADANGSNVITVYEFDDNNAAVNVHWTSGVTPVVVGLPVAGATLGIDGTASFSGLISAAAVPTADAHLVNKLYADNLVAGVDLSGIATNAANLTQEIADRQAGDAAEATARASAIAAEAASRSTADTTLQSNIDAEATARAAAITALTNGAVAQNTAAIAAEVNTDRDAAITVAINALTNGAVAANTANLTQEIADRIADVNAETAAREAAVTTLQNSLSSTNSDVTDNANAIAAEETARIAADTVLTNGKVDKQSSVNVHMVGETAAASTPVDAQGVDNYLFLVVDKATGAIKSIEKSFLEAE